MHSILPIYKLTLRSILRERVALSMLGLLALVLILLPSEIESDGTLQGAIRMQIRYGLGFSSILLAAMTLWVSCASIAGDLSSKRLHMVLTKPVSRAAIWWGKWLAVVSLVTVLTMMCGIVTYVRVQNSLGADSVSPDEKAMLLSQQITARRPIDPLQEDVSEEAETLADEQIASGAVPPNIERSLVVAEMERFLRVSRNAASAGEIIRWTFELNRPLEAGNTFQLFYEYEGAAMALKNIPGTWSLLGENEQKFFSVDTLETPYGENVIPIRVRPEMTGTKTLTVTFENRSEDAGRIFFKTDRGVRLLFDAGGFIFNLFRALLLISGLLAILAAIGVSAGSTFSLPVACYVSAVVLMLQAFSGVVEEVVEKGPPPREPEQSYFAYGMDQFQFKVYQGVLTVLKPIQVESPLGRVSSGIVISTTELLKIYILRFTPIILLLSCGGILLFSKREVGGAV